MNSTTSNIYFGGIDYQAQIEMLMDYSSDPLVIFYDQSKLGTTLKEKTRDTYLLHEDNNSKKHIYSYGVAQKTSNLKSQLSENKKIDFATFFLNTPIVKSGMIMSQITLYDVNTTNILSTQINYDPLIFTITQNHDRKNMIIANSININNNVMVEANNLLNNDISYDWINYATTVGIDYFYYLSSTNKREYPLELTNNQIKYPIILVEPGYSKFLTIDE
jgi:SRSO17 transposase